MRVIQNVVSGMFTGPAQEYHSKAQVTLGWPMCQWESPFVRILSS